jgi:putative Mg2+ transporter-C (MgtC) family protein
MPLDTQFLHMIAATLLCGGVLGLERQLRGKVAGARTSILICLGTMVFVHLGAGFGSASDPSRVLGQVVTGIGFLGAGVILARGGKIIGVTTAALIWVLAAIGSTIGLGRFIEAFTLTAVTLGVTAGLEWLEIGLRRLFGLEETEPGAED